MLIDDNILVEAFLDDASSTFSYLVVDRLTLSGAIIDSVLNFDSKSGRTHTQSANALVSRVQQLGVRVMWILETHVHADHLSAAPYLKDRLGGQIAIGSHITDVQRAFGALFNEGDQFKRDGSQFDALFEDGDHFLIGSLNAQALHTPGHTPACMTYVISAGDHTLAFVGDTLFMPDYGTARCDFPGGDARTLYRSIKKILALPTDTLIYMCHDYRPNGRPIEYLTTVDAQRKHNIHVHDGLGEDDFVAMREARDVTLAMPALILPSVQVNMRSGHLPEAEANGVRYLKIPINAL
ncbi:MULTISPECIES: MBL fold metallo-hydrolase [unclassified Pseudomonas]|uniref:MBL fold metallo-hydrolase n=1 Tax=unclassified Pseudomonas TaxID=196821 RepID=UPI000D342D1A|nr:MULTISPECIES: MBL fold metallo-hydrolase [unclassified Pseudomonas]RAU48517.1 MBL fold metallo-hydrolase [Pseudomonas sp. RIT 409]RAU54222.1 MBL fold metallo-hydrolase [Pseudomonas sp. RIT 412]